jgi:hypothetical protein
VSETIPLRPLSVVDEGDDVLVGDPETGTFVSLPPVGGVVIRALQRGATVEEAGRDAAALAGMPVDMEAFVTALHDLGFVATGEEVAGTDDTPTPQRTAAIQGRRWLRGPRPELVRPLFGRVAWCLYATLALFDIGCLLLRPELRPDHRDAFALDDIGLSALLLIPCATVIMALHEGWHWLAARNAGVAARFGIDRRMVFLVFETDLSQLWSVPRRRRYGPVLAGLAIDSAVLSLLLGARLAAEEGLWSPPRLMLRLLGAWAFIQIASMLWQLMVFLRTDLYALLVFASGCRNLWRVKSLLLSQALGRLTPDQADELTAASPRDISLGRWFRWVWLGGFGLIAAWALVFWLPVQLRILEWTWDGLAQGPTTGDFWFTAACSSILLWGPLLVLVLAARDAAGRIGARRVRQRTVA